MLNKLSIKWKMTIWSAIIIFLIFMICNLIQLILIQTFISKQEEDLLYKRSKEIHTFISEQSKIQNGKELNIFVAEKFFEKITERNEMIRILDIKGNELYTVSNDLPEIKNDSVPLPNGFYQMHVQGENVLLLKTPLRTASFSGTIEIGKSAEMFDTLLEKVIWILMLGTFLSLALSLISGRILAGKLVSPLRGLTNTMRKIEDHQFQERVQEMETNDEFSQLSSIFNSMMDKIEESIQQQKRFVEDASHELRTPLAIIHGHLSLLQRWGKEDKEILESSLNTSIKEANRMIDLTNELLLLTQIEKKREHGPFSPCPALEILNEVIGNYQLLHENLKINKHFTTNEEILLAIPQEQLKQILIIIFDNAVKYSGDDKEISINTSAGNGKYKMKIQDNGYGISQEDLPYIFDRFYRVDKARSRSKGGNGLGLSIAKNIIDEFNGEIKVESTSGKGTTIILLLEYAS